jgi:hypothetical protein
MTLCPTCRLPIAFHDEAAHCTVPARTLRTAIMAAKVFRLALASTPLDHAARAAMLAQVDEQVAYLETVTDETL